MTNYRSNWWSIELPSDWVSEDQPECTAFIPDSGSGVLQISSARNEVGPATDDDLRDFAKEHLDAGAPLWPVSCGRFIGFYLHFSVEDMYQRQWWLRSGGTVVLATYTCELDEKGSNDEIVDQMLRSLGER